MTELIFTNVFKGMNAGQIAALLSCLCSRIRLDKMKERTRKNATGA